MSLLPGAKLLFPGTMPWNVLLDCDRFDSVLPIFLNVSAKMMLMPLPTSMNTLDILKSQICASTTRAACPGLGSAGGWSALENVISVSDPRRYSGIAGGATMAW